DDGSVVDEDVDLAEAGQHRLDRGVDRLDRTDVGIDGEHLAVGAVFCRESVEQLLVAIPDGHRATMLEHAFSNSQTYALPSSGDDGDAIFEIVAVHVTFIQVAKGRRRTCWPGARN